MLYKEIFQKVKKKICFCKLDLNNCLQVCFVLRYFDVVLILIIFYFITEKDSGFLRIGSLNVRVKRTTEAVSNFLGVSQSNLDKAHKTWGSADSIQVKKRLIYYFIFFNNVSNYLPYFLSLIFLSSISKNSTLFASSHILNWQNFPELCSQFTGSTNEMDYVSLYFSNFLKIYSFYFIFCNFIALKHFYEFCKTELYFWITS